MHSKNSRSRNRSAIGLQTTLMLQLTHYIMENHMLRCTQFQHHSKFIAMPLRLFSGGSRRRKGFNFWRRMGRGEGQDWDICSV